MDYCYSIAIIVLLLPVIYYLYAKHKLSYWSKRGVKTPPASIFWGNFKDVFFLRKPPGLVMREIYEYADPDDPYIGFYIWLMPMLLLRSHDLAKQAMIKDFDVFSHRRFGSTSEKDLLSMTNLLSIKQPKWKYLKSKLTPVLTGQKLKKMIPLIVESTVPMLHYIDNLPTNEDGCKREEAKLIGSRYTTDIMSSLAFGISTNSFDKNNTFWEQGLKLFNGLKAAIVLNISFFMPRMRFLYEPFMKDIAQYFRTVFWDSMNHREATGNQRGDLVDYLLALKNGEQNPDFKFEGDNLVAQSTAFYIAGYEATASAIAFALFELARHPEYQASLYDEIEATMSEKELTLEVINDMSLLDSIINEVMRLYPPLPVTDRIAQRDYELPGTGLIIEKGVPIYLSINSMNQDPKVFSNPLDFIPSRTVAENKKFHESLAFGIGPRACIGQRLAYLIVKSIVIIIIRTYILSYKKTEVSDEKTPSVFSYTVDGLNLYFKKRT